MVVAGSPQPLRTSQEAVQTYGVVTEASRPPAALHHLQRVPDDGLFALGLTGSRSAGTTADRPLGVLRAAGLEGKRVADLMDAATMLIEEWSAVTPSTIAHCWLKSKALSAPQIADLTQLHGAYRVSFRTVADDATAAMDMMRRCALEDTLFRGVLQRDRRAGIEEWMAVEDNRAVLLRTADLCLTDSAANVDSDDNCAEEKGGRDEGNDADNGEQRVDKEGGEADGSNESNGDSEGEDSAGGDLESGDVEDEAADGEEEGCRVEMGGNSKASQDAAVNEMDTAGDEGGNKTEWSWSSDEVSSWVSSSKNAEEEVDRDGTMQN